MGNIIIVAETGSDIPVDVADRNGIYLVPMHVSLGDTTLDDGSFPVLKICEYYSGTGKLPKTSGSSPEDFEKVFDEIHFLWPEKHILHLAYSSATTCSYQSALLIGAERDYVTSIDTKHVSAGQAAVILKVARILEEVPGLSPKEVYETVDKVCRQTHMCFLPGDLEYLRAGGRVGNVAYLGGKLLHLHPCIEIIDGHLLATQKYRGSLLKIVPRLIREFSRKHQFQKEQLYLLWSIGLDEDIRVAAEAEARNCGFREITWVQTGCVITAHCGPGAFGIVGFSESDQVTN